MVLYFRMNKSTNSTIFDIRW